MRRLLSVAIVLLALPAAADAAPARIAFSTDDGIDVMAADGSGRGPLLRRRGFTFAQPAWSPDGTALAFSAYSQDDEAPGRVWVARADGSGVRQLTPQPRATLFDQAPAWSPDGRRIAFVRLRAVGEDTVRSQLVTVAASGTDARVVVERTVTNRIDFVTHVAWAPDGSRLLYTRTRINRFDRLIPSLWSVAPDGSGSRPFKRDAGFASFSADGSRIAYSSIADRNGETCGSDECRTNGEIYVMNADGTAPRRLTVNGGDDSAPAWAPDGARIAFQSTRNYPSHGQEELYSVAADGSCLTWLTNGTGSSTAPAWQPGEGSSDPGACGTTTRPALVTTSLTRLGAFKPFRPWWLGSESPDSLLLTQADAGHGVSLVYDDCGLFDPAACPPPVYLNETRSCSRGTLMLYGDNPRRLRAFRGAITYGVTGFGPRYGGTDLYVGGATINIDATSRGRIHVVLAQLRRLGEAGPPARLPRAGFPRRIWRPLDRVAAARRRLGSTRAVAQRLHLDRGDVRERLALRRKLLKLGARRLRC